ncbi:MAG TPA: AI-2E family transporter [Thermoleophilia bacterium]|nr:AI-2E family transporter [Thermoleophilia bacterium]
MTSEQGAPTTAPAATGQDAHKAAAAGATSRWAVAAWASDIGKWSGIIILVILLVVVVFFLLAATRVLLLAALFAVLFAGTFLPMVDWLQKHHVKRGLGAVIVSALLILLGIAVGALIVYSVIKQLPTVEARLDDAWTEIQKALTSTSVSQEQIDSLKSNVQNLAKDAASGLAGTVVDLFGGVASLIFGAFISLNILVWSLIQGRKLARWASKRMGPVPPAVGYEIFANSARFFRGYLFGSTLVGLFNGAVMGIGALIIGVPLAGTIFVVGWFTNYIPFFGAIVSGAFAVLIALGAGGPAMAIPMLIIVIVSNGYLQTIVSQFALGSALKLHPLAVLFATTAGSMLFGAVGGVFAAPFLKIFLDARLKMKAAGLFSSSPTAGSAAAGAPPSDQGAGPPGTAESLPAEA